MPTFDELVDDVLTHLHNNTQTQEQLYTLKENLTIDGAGFGVAESGTQIGTGLYEIDDELVRVQSFDASTGTAVVPAWGRGQQGSAAAVHTAGSKITAVPRYPRVKVKRVVNEVTHGLYPNLFGVATVAAPTLISSLYGYYELPADARVVLRVELDYAGAWVSVDQWRLSQGTDNTSGVRLEIDAAVTTYPIRVTYGFVPRALVNGTDDFEAVTGLAGTASSVVMFGAAARLISAGEAGRQTPGTVEQSVRSQVVGNGHASAAAGTFMSFYQELLRDERVRLRQRWPTRIVRV